LGIYIGFEKFISTKPETVMSALVQQADENMAYATGNGHRAFYLLLSPKDDKPRYNWLGQCQVLEPDKKGGGPHHWLRNFRCDLVQMRLKKKHGGCDLGIQEDIPLSLVLKKILGVLSNYCLTYSHRGSWPTLC
jgi:hypothetical protein